MSWQEFFDRQIQLWGEDTQKQLSNKSILIVGAGGLGCSVAYGLGGSGIGAIDIVDFDKVSMSNLHRQIAFEIDDIGSFKSQILAKKLSNKNPYTKFNSYKVGFEEFIKTNTKEYDLIIDATDSMQTRVAIDKHAKSKKIAWVYGSVEEFMGQVCLFEESSYSEFNQTQTSIKGISAPMVMHIASLQSNLALRYLCALDVSKDLLYYIYFKNGELITQKFKMPKGK
jgi:molybdopterin/thiamine biosynthesis adenylyltransferase